MRLFCCLILFLLCLPEQGRAAMNAQKFTYGSDASQFGELTVPDPLPGQQGPFPTVVLVHGGCWLAQYGLDLMRPLAVDLSESGVAVWNIEYRRIGQAGGGYPGTFTDVGRAMDVLRTLAPTYNLDIQHVVVVGHSAGGQLALWAAGRHNLLANDALYVPDPLPVHGVVTLSGINDLAAYHDYGPRACGGPQTIDRLVDADGRVDPYRNTSPAALLPLNTTQVVVTGSIDPIVPAQFGKDYGLKAVVAGDKVNSLDIEGIGHFEMIDPLTAAWAQIKTHLLTMFD